MISNPKMQGFSLIEILITVIILTGAAIALTKFQAIQMQGTSDARNRNEAINLAQSELDQYRQQFQKSAISDKAETTVTGKSAVFTVSATVNSLAINTGQTITVPSASPLPAPSPAQVVSNVSWVNSQGQTQTVTLATILRYNAQGKSAPSAATPAPTAGPTATPAPTAAPAAAWAAGKNYTAGEKVSYNGSTYEALYAHTSQSPYPPDSYNYWRKL